MTASVYVIHEIGTDSPVKIGVAVNALLRLSNLQSGNHRRLVLTHVKEFPTEDVARAVERACHAHAENLCVSGEWFMLTVDSAIDLVNSVSPYEAPDNVASRVIAKVGSPRAVADALGCDVSRVHRWTYPKERGGTGGEIPAARQRQLLAKFPALLTPADFFEPTVAA